MYFLLLCWITGWGDDKALTVQSWDPVSNLSAGVPPIWAQRSRNGKSLGLAGKPVACLAPGGVLSSARSPVLKNKVKNDWGRLLMSAYGLHMLTRASELACTCARTHTHTNVHTKVGTKSVNSSYSLTQFCPRHFFLCEALCHNTWSIRHYFLKLCSRQSPESWVPGIMYVKKKKSWMKLVESPRSLQRAVIAHLQYPALPTPPLIPSTSPQVQLQTPRIKSYSLTMSSLQGFCACECLRNVMSKCVRWPKHEFPSEAWISL